ncbi:aldehyde dehydrogenase [Curtobacterium sp. MCSS17_006]|uniref:aldehyde dehydrogenase family protein n=1 Tax=Curtobacterium sp. MCSS17_006 TaxID=2175642 RepID=UPI000DA77079|nr:aldehyde dehydrogenase family protein [Curtobacterium sp. MCSS17_006]PZE31448.1 aldehyde dehydrogenase [Curtobacterium sp. MCSS17_006]
MTTTAPAPYEGFDRLFIGGEWRPGSSDRTGQDTNPWTDETLLELSLAGQDDVDAAYEAARAAQVDWARATTAERAGVITRAVQVFDDRRDEITDWLVREAGSTRFKAEFEWDTARAVTQEAASFPYRVHGEIRGSDIPGKENRAYRDPLGVVCVISPWNFPLQLSQRSVAPALALGNAVVLKPASDTPVAGGLLLAKVFEEAGLPAGLLNVVVGAGSEIGDYVVEHPVPKLVSFTGSTAVGRHIGELATGGEHVKRVALELGGNAPFVVLDDADVEQAARAAVFSRFLHQGQVCMSTNRIVVDTSVHDAFVEAFVARVGALRVGDVDDPETFIGPVVNDKQLESLQQKIATARDEGARQVLGGDADGRVLPPHVFVDVTQDMSIAREESFGPIVPIIRADGEEDALRIANDTDYGLSSAVFTRDLERGDRFARRIDAGMTHVNDVSDEDEANAPFGGEKNSGLGRFRGDWIIDELTKLHWVSIQRSQRGYPLV